MSIKSMGRSVLLKIFNFLPNRIGFASYHLFQSIYEGARIPLKLSTTESTYFGLLRIANKLNITIENKKIIEIGSGWLPLIPYHFLFMGKAKEVNTYDLYKHFTRKSIGKLNRAYQKKYKIKLSKLKQPFLLPEGVNYYPNTNLIFEKKLAADIVFSRFVLEHVRPEDIYEMHSTFKKSLSPGSYIFHFISPSDHRAYIDKSLSLQDFLKYSPEEWNNKITKFDYHNRLRLPQYIQTFKDLHYEIVYLEYDVPPKDSINFQKFQELSLHADFEKYSEEELLAGSINIVLKV